eukprot:4049286-Prymnesium_polylepis.1
MAAGCADTIDSSVMQVAEQAHVACPESPRKRASSSDSLTTPVAGPVESAPSSARAESFTPAPAETSNHLFGCVCGRQRRATMLI